MKSCDCFCQGLSASGSFLFLPDRLRCAKGDDPPLLVLSAAVIAVAVVVGEGAGENG
jgi:hypothetical protein